jgi:hypothetical protein
MRKFSKKQYLAAGAAAVIVAAGAGVAFAYWTADGTGTGSASTGTTTGIDINQTSVITGLYPGGAPVALAGNFDNNNSGPIHVAQVTVAVASGWSEQADLTKPACTAADFTLTQPDPTNAEIPAGSGVSSWSGATIQLTDLATNQDNCKNVTVDLAYTSN